MAFFGDWLYTPPDPAEVRRLADALGIGRVTASVLISRGVTEPEGARRFFQPQEDSGLDPLALTGVAEAVSRILAAAEKGESVLVFGDYDADGITSTALLLELLRGPLGMERVEYLLPVRSEGYGLVPATVGLILEKRPDLLITVDNGVAAAAEIDKLRSAGIDCIVVDHHEPAELAPHAVLVAPKLTGEEEFKVLAGVGLAYKLAEAVLLEHWGEAGKAAAWLDTVIDLAAIGTVADVVPMTGENRRITRLGLQAISDRERLQRPGLRALLERLFKKDGEPDGWPRLRTRDIGMLVAPNLNACGRMEEERFAEGPSGPEWGLLALLAVTAEEAEPYISHMVKLNANRRSEQEKMTARAEEIADGFAGQPALVIAGRGWREGIAGIVAGRIAESRNAPTIILCIDDSGTTAKGSGRSVGTFDMHAALTYASGHLHRFGGHAAAVGMTLRLEEEPERLAEDDEPHQYEMTLTSETPIDEAVENFRRDFVAFCVEHMSEADRLGALRLDCVVDPAELDAALVEELAGMEPFGCANERPLLALSGVHLLKRKALFKNGKARHFKFTLSGRKPIGGIAFGLGEAAITLEQHTGSFDIAFHPVIDDWNGVQAVSIQAEAVSAMPKLIPGTQGIDEGAEGRPDAGPKGARSEVPAPPVGREVIDARGRAKESALFRLVGGPPLLVFVNDDAEARDLRSRLVALQLVLPGEAAVLAGDAQPDADMAARLSDGALRVLFLSRPFRTGCPCELVLHSLPYSEAQLIALLKAAAPAALHLHFGPADAERNLKDFASHTAAADDVVRARDAQPVSSPAELAERLGWSSSRAEKSLAALRWLGENGGNALDSPIIKEGVRKLQEVERFGRWAMDAPAGEFDRLLEG